MTAISVLMRSGVDKVDRWHSSEIDCANSSLGTSTSSHFSSLPTYCTHTKTNLNCAVRYIYLHCQGSTAVLTIYLLVFWFKWSVSDVPVHKRSHKTCMLCKRFVSLCTSLIYSKCQLVCQPLKGLFQRPGILNIMTRIPELLPRIAFM
jgi:hypothetical protein